MTGPEDNVEEGTFWGTYGRTPAKTLQATDKLSAFKKYYPLATMLVTIVIGIGMSIFFLVSLELGLAFSLLPPLLLITGGIFTYLVLSSWMHRSQWPVNIYQDGIEFHNFPFDRMIRKKAFVPTSAMRKVILRRTVWKKAGQPDKEEHELWIQAFRGSLYTSGPRSKQEVLPAVEYIRKEWRVEIAEQTVTLEGGQVKVDDGSAPAQPGKARKMPVAPQPPALAASRYCIYCGAGVREGTRFCPSCGRSLEVRSAMQDETYSPYAREPDPMRPPRPGQP